MYEDLVKSLRDCAEVKSLSLHKRVLMAEAARAIEMLSKWLGDLIAQSGALCERIEELENSRCPHYIRNVHDEGDDSLCTVFSCDIGALPEPSKEEI